MYFFFNIVHEYMSTAIFFQCIFYSLRSGRRVAGGVAAARAGLDNWNLKAAESQWQ